MREKNQDSMKTVGFGISESLAIKPAWGQFAPSTLDSLSLFSALTAQNVFFASKIIVKQSFLL